MNLHRKKPVRALMQIFYVVSIHSEMRNVDNQSLNVVEVLDMLNDFLKTWLKIGAQNMLSTNLNYIVDRFCSIPVTRLDTAPFELYFLGTKLSKNH